MTPKAEWDRCRPWIEAAIKRTQFYEIQDIEREISEGAMTFWPGEHGAAVTEFITYPNGKALNVFAVGGDSHEAMKELVEVFEPSMRAWALASNCRWIIGYGRDGWQKYAKPMGYQPIWTVLCKEVA